MNDKFLIGIALGMLGGAVITANSCKVRKTICDCQQQISDKAQALAKKQKCECNE